MFYLNKNLKDELNKYYKKLENIERTVKAIDVENVHQQISINNNTDKIDFLERVLKEYINKNNKEIKQIKNTTNIDNKYISKKQKEQSKINEEIAKKYKILLEGLNETRLAIQTIAKILQENNMLKLKEENNDARETSDKRK